MKWPENLSISEKDKFFIEKIIDAQTKAELALSVLLNLVELLVRKGLITADEARSLTKSSDTVTLLNNMIKEHDEAPKVS